jgi:hypothetical protein
MEFIRTLSEKTNTYTEKIKQSSFIEGNKQTIVKAKTKSYSSLLEVFLKLNDIEYDILEANQISSFIMESKLKIASELRMDDINEKVLSKSKIQTGLLQDNCLSTILYLNNYYKTNCIIHNKQTNKYYQTGVRLYSPFVVTYHSDQWFLETNVPETITFSSLTDLQTLITMDIETNEIYKTPLKAISNYKLSDLETLANQYNIELREGTKKKKKKDLYEEIKLKIIQKPI